MSISALLIASFGLASQSLPRAAIGERCAPRMGLFDALLGERQGCNYDNLAGRPDSWGRDAAAIALAGEVRTHTTDGLAIATFAGGCFWGIELAFQRVPGVACTAVGYCQGKVSRPTYNEVCGAATGHTEAVQVVYDPAQVEYSALCAVLMGRLGRSMFMTNQVGNDRGPQYRHGIYTHTAEQAEAARAVLDALQAQVPNSKIRTELEPVQIFWPAEEYHQQYLEKGGRFKSPQSAAKGCTDEIRCYG
ncbi:hypothetical protein KFE25_011980 [Diacronema lutheri]|uniref:peptide-methionine (S)-S-oxide reductase n=1 Tax=Diacronema lutheri TaxID=2081491 RepID=A0A8J6C1W3_DIALT|nr:hypothetical protein KFE25_011980 [Diacronema lutheri]